MLRFISTLVLPLVPAVAAMAAEPPKPTHADVSYGNDPRQVLDFYRAESAAPTPLLFFVHGGGWLNGDKRTFNDMGPYLAAGISVVSVEYRFVSQAQRAGIKPPVMWPLYDAARALQFVRSKSPEWNIDKERIGASGSSAGACTCLWLAFHPDMADPRSADPVARESTRLYCAAVMRAQTSLDPRQMTEWIPNNRYGAHAFGFTSATGLRRDAYDEFLAERDEILPWIREYSPYELATPEDPPIGLYYDSEPAMGKDQANPAHSANFGQGLAEKLKRLGVEHEFVHPGAPSKEHPTIHDYLIAKLGGRPHK